MPFPCSKCSKVFDSKTKLEAHVNRVVSCISDIIKNDPNACILCGHVFSSISNLNRHNKSCIVRKNPVLAVKRLENSKIVVTKVDKSIRNKTIHKSVDKSIHNVDNSVDNKTVNINIVNINVPESNILTFRKKEINIMVKWFLKTPDYYKFMAKFVELYRCNRIREATKLILNALHNNPKYESGQNLMYCHSGKFSGKFIAYVDTKWLISNLDTIINIIQAEIDVLMSKANKFKNYTYSDDERKDEFAENAKNMRKYANFITSIIKRFMKSKSKKYPVVESDKLNDIVKRALDTKFNLLTNEKLDEDDSSIRDTDSSDPSNNESDASDNTDSSDSSDESDD